MAGLSGFEISILVVVVFLAIVVVALLLYLLRRLRSRRTKLLNELDNRPQLTQDRAFNRLAMARREAHVLADQGVDVTRAQELIAESQGAFDNRHYDRAYEAAQSAHEALVNARLKGRLTTGAPLPSSPPTVGRGAPASAPSPVPTPPPAETPARPTIAKNQAESQFQIRLLDEELGALPARRAKDPGRLQAAEYARLASEAFAKGDYTEAFRLALKGRRALGGPVESLPLTGGGAEAGATASGNGGVARADIAETAATVAGGERCPECGYPTLAGDSFCRGCGRPKGPVTCPSCGAPRGADESFCGRCGTRFP